jgi:hypothetical protein
LKPPSLDLVGRGGISPCLVLWRGTCHGWLSPANGDPGSTQILTQHRGARPQTIRQLENSGTTPTSKSPLFSRSGLLKHLRMGTVCMPHHFLTIQTESWGFIKPSVQTYTIHMKLSLHLSFQPRCSLGGYDGHHHGIPCPGHGCLSPMITPLNLVVVPTVSYEYLFCLPLSEWL